MQVAIDSGWDILIPTCIVGIMMSAVIPSLFKTKPKHISSVRILYFLFFFFSYGNATVNLTEY